jgi:hypothetical protein
MKSIFTTLLLLAVAFNLQAQQKVVDTFFKNTDTFLKKHVGNNGVNYTAVKNDASLDALIKTIAEVDLTNVDAFNKEAFYINAYNLLVINAAAKGYPLASVQDISGFFDSKKHTVSGEQTTLNDLEKDKLLKVYKDPRFHFVLVCGALGCPPITNFAYVPNKLEEQLEIQTRKALNDNTFIQTSNSEEVQLSQIFEWYPGDFGGNKKTAIEYINGYRENKIPAKVKVGFYPYDWTLNDNKVKTTTTASDINTTGDAANAARYVVSSAIPKGKIEIKIFNNLYSQRLGTAGNLTTREDYFSTNMSFLYGFTNRFNAGFDFRYRRVANTNLPSSPFGVLGNNADISSRTGFTNFGPKIRVAPFPALENFSFQSAYWFPLGDDLEGAANKPYIDWNGGTFITQFFNDFSIGESFSLFTEIDFWAEDIGKNQSSEEREFVNRVSTPISAIFSYFPNQKTTIYALSSFSPYYNQSGDKYFYQFGLGAKYQFTPDFEIELLLTDFNGQNLNKNGGQATTFNIGFRYSN